MGVVRFPGARTKSKMFSSKLMGDTVDGGVGKGEGTLNSTHRGELRTEMDTKLEKLESGTELSSWNQLRVPAKQLRLSEWEADLSDRLQPLVPCMRRSPFLGS